MKHPKAVEALIQIIIPPDEHVNTWLKQNNTSREQFDADIQKCLDAGYSIDEQIAGARIMFDRG